MCLEWPVNTSKDDIVANSDECQQKCRLLKDRVAQYDRWLSVRSTSEYVLIVLSGLLRLFGDLCIGRFLQRRYQIASS
jgi:hypothetical protein